MFVDLKPPNFICFMFMMTEALYSDFDPYIKLNIDKHTTNEAFFDLTYARDENAISISALS